MEATGGQGSLTRKSRLDPEKISASHCFGNLFNAYTKAFNKIYQRTGSLFEKPFHRVPVTNDPYLQNLALAEKGYDTGVSTGQPLAVPKTPDR